MRCGFLNKDRRRRQTKQHEKRESDAISRLIRLHPMTFFCTKKSCTIFRM